jgi:uncharacterized protein DUF4112
MKSAFAGLAGGRIMSLAGRFYVHWEEDIRRLESIADLLDSRFRIPGTDIRFGLDALLGLIPGIGDGVSLLPALYLMMEAKKLGASKFLLTRMAMNVGIDWLVGSIPLLGDIFDVGFKANRRNIKLLRDTLVAGSSSRPASMLRDVPRA